ncbi:MULTISPECIES: restriction endonuclease [Thiorhodovibrio]|uniref:restriction endonuclease n=1 Tax=Thiorhodovibrio TaxID=61593 RepID=UPI0019117DAB|nr:MULTISPECIES: restriction endonuclease [Thiorhodovibrio]MBK5967812.1 restriction endonuclease [Thiorhodovibrio winogradskyi]WPL14382.1 EcoKMrr [Thiorhodovibrio litoralis]
MKAGSKAEFVKWFGPVLDALRDLGDSGRPQEVSAQIAKNLHLPDDILDETLKSGGSRFHNQVAWARQYLVWEGLLDSSKHGTWTLTEKGRTAHLTDEESRAIFLKWVAIHAENRKQKQQSEAVASGEDEEETLESDQAIPVAAPDLITTLRALSPLGFEKVCRELLRESGFENVEITGGSADGGIDGFGTLEINPFVSFKVLFQCKRYAKDNLVSRAQVGDFRNAMIGRAEKGIIITTSGFTNAANQEANREGAPKVELVDGVKLVEMFERAELGLKRRVVFDVDLAYFEKYR